jgi:hypothetical protein
MLYNFEVSQTAGILLWADLISLRNLDFWPKQIESKETFNTRIVDRVFVFLADIYTPSYNQRFGSYDFWNSARSLKFCSEQIRNFWEFCNPDPNSKVILGNFHCQHRSWLSPFSCSYLCASIWLTVQKLRSFKLVGAIGNFCLHRRKVLTNFRIWS